jgi:hypothetical protein
MGECARVGLVWFWLLPQTPAITAHGSLDLKQEIQIQIQIQIRSQTPKHVRGGWSHYTDTSEPVDGNGAQTMVTVQSGFLARGLSITGPTYALTTCANRTHARVRPDSEAPLNEERAGPCDLDDNMDEYYMYFNTCRRSRSPML